MNTIITFKIQRFNPKKDKAPYFNEYQVPLSPYMRVLDGLNYIYENYDETLAYRWVCRAGQCGSCAIEINGKVGLACKTEVTEDVKEITLRPLYLFPIIKDLVVDMGEGWNRLLEIRPFVERDKYPEEFVRLYPEEVEELKELRQCIECWSCVASCPVTRSAWNDMVVRSGNLLPLPLSGEKLAIYDGYKDDILDRIGIFFKYGLYKCTSCKNCAAVCPQEIDIPEKVFIKLKSRAVERSLVLPKTRDFLENVYLKGNPYGEERSKRDKWAEGMKIKRYDEDDEFLYYVGCVGSYDTRAQNAARAFGDILTKCNISFGILGEEEVCDGNEVKNLGELGLFQELADKNIEKFKEIGVKKIVTLSPHSYNAIKNDYPKEGGKFEVYHYTQLLRELIDQKKIGLTELDAKIVYHDSCFLGRYNGEYDAPRDILNAIPGVKLIEMEKNKDNSLCCGGGSGNFYIDFLGEYTNSPARIRVRDAYSTGADILAVACPICLTMFEDAVKVEGLEEKLVVKDISEIVNDLSQSKK